MQNVQEIIAENRKASLHPQTFELSKTNRQINPLTTVIEK
jgi:hypothetical protein